MLDSLKAEANRTYTENGALTHETSGSDCLDLFATVGALRTADEAEIRKRFVRAFTENPDLALKTLFYARDVRGGLGERRVFRICLNWLAYNAPASLKKNLPYVAKFGRWDDLLSLMNSPCEKEALSLIKEQLEADLNAMETDGEISLLAKWLPSVNASNERTVLYGKRIAKFLGMTEATYRKTLVKLRECIRILENDLREKDYTFDYSKQPSKAMFKYRKAFLRNDRERYRTFMEKVSGGDAQLHTGTLLPYEIIQPFFTGRYLGAGSLQEADAIDVTWKAQEDFTGDENALVVIDGSWSMYAGSDPIPATVALSLGIYYAERNTGAFRNHFITFSENPKLVEIKGEAIIDKIRYCQSFNEMANTNIQKVFELILNAAVKRKVPQEEMPSTLYIISDMEFDHCTEEASLTNFQYAKKLFAEAGYTLPHVVFWNVQSRNRQQPVTQNEQGVALVSGCSARIFSMLQSGLLSPMEYMLDILGAERYASIVA
ncbi:MAG: DUF2828 family protein [Oscillospiraceae bacterium]|nr:DUF2828 family protein [Oscillospiraceae bacterium]